jgi:hypothetical protein
MAADSDEPAAIAARRKALNLVSSNRWCVGAPICPSRAWGIFAATPAATRGCLSLCTGSVTGVPRATAPLLDYYGNTLVTTKSSRGCFEP